MNRPGLRTAALTSGLGLYVRAQSSSSTRALSLTIDGQFITSESCPKILWFLCRPCNIIPWHRQHKDVGSLYDLAPMWITHGDRLSWTAYRQLTSKGEGSTPEDVWQCHLEHRPRVASWFNLSWRQNRDMNWSHLVELPEFDVHISLIVYYILIEVILYIIIYTFDCFPKQLAFYL